MYTDEKPCAACGSEVRLRARLPDGDGPDGPAVSDAHDGPVGPVDGVVGTADETVDERVCTAADCPTHADVSLHP